MTTDRHNIVLTGFMGTGKTAVGRRVAQRSGREFVDVDAEIESRHGSIPEIFATGGEEYFRELERAVVTELAPRRNLVIATGGGTLLDEENVIAFLGADIYTLTADPDTILERVESDGLAGRPLLADTDDPRRAIEELLGARTDAYAKFTAIDTAGRSVDEVVDALEAAGADISEPEPASGLAGGDGDPRERVLYAVIAVALAMLIIVLILLFSF